MAQRIRNARKHLAQTSAGPVLYLHRSREVRELRTARPSAQPLQRLVEPLASLQIPDCPLQLSRQRLAAVVGGILERLHQRGTRIERDAEQAQCLGHTLLQLAQVAALSGRCERAGKPGASHSQLPHAREQATSLFHERVGVAPQMREYPGDAVGSRPRRNERNHEQHCTEWRHASTSSALAMPR